MIGQDMTEMEKSPSGKKFIWKINLACLAFTLVYFAAVLLLTPAILSSDERGRTQIASGLLGGAATAFVPFSNISYGGILAALYACLPGINWYTILFLFIEAFSLWAVMRKTAVEAAVRRGDGRIPWGFLPVSLAVFHALNYCFITEVKFTHTAAVAAAALVYCLGPGDREGKRGTGAGDQVILMILFLFSFIVRISIFYMAAPALGLTVLLGLRREKRVRTAVQLAAAALLVVLFVTMDNGMWAQGRPGFRQLNSYRSRVQDYGGMPAMEGNEDFFQQQGISEAEYGIMRRGFWGISEHSTADTLRAVIEVKHEAEEPVRITELFGQIFTGQDGIPYGIWAALAVLLILCFALGFRNRDLRLILLTLGSLLAWLAESGYLQWNGRTPFRVIYATDMTFLVTLIVFARSGIRRKARNGGAGEAEDKRPGRKWTRRVPALALSAGIALLAWNTTDSTLQGYAALEKDNEMYRPVIEYAEANPDLLFLGIMNVTETASPAGRKTDNLFKMTGWISLTKEWQERVRGDCGNPVKALLEREDIRVIARSDKPVRDLESYLKEQAAENGYDAEILLECEDTITSGKIRHGVWKITRNGKGL